MPNKSLFELMETSLKRADEALREASASPAARHLRLAGVELLRAARYGLDGAIDALEPKRHPQDDSSEPKQ